MIRQLDFERPDVLTSEHNDALLQLKFGGRGVQHAGAQIAIAKENLVSSKKAYLGGPKSFIRTPRYMRVRTHLVDARQTVF